MAMKRVKCATRAVSVTRGKEVWITRHSWQRQPRWKPESSLNAV